MSLDIPPEQKPSHYDGVAIVLAAFAAFVTMIIWVF